jgi:hypothetical protein
MRALSDLRRNDVIRAVTLVALVAFPLMAYAQLGPAATAMKPSNDAASTVAEPATPAQGPVDPCANQHWPFFSAECLRGSTQTIKPRLVSMNVDDFTAAAPPKPVATDHRQVVRPAASGHDGATSTGLRKPAKPRIAHTRARKPLSLSYAASGAAVPGAMPGW